MNLSRTWFLLASSVLMYGLALMVSPLFWWASFLFLTPLLYGGSTRSLTFKQGFIYGLLQWGFPSFGVIYSLVQLCHYSFSICIIPPLLIVLYQAIFTGLWFWGTSKILTKVPSGSLTRLMVWCITSYLYFYWIVHLSLSALNKWEGYFLMNPLLPLAEYPPLLHFLPLMGKEALLCILILTNASLVVPLLIKNYWPKTYSKTVYFGIWIIPLVALVPWIMSVVHAPEQKTAPSWVASISLVRKKYGAESELTPLAQEIKRDVQKILIKNPSIELIILPESSLEGVNLSTAKELGDYWNQKHVGKPINLVIGAFCWQGNKYHNTAYWLYDGTIKDLFHKRRPMALLEEVFGWYDFKFIRRLYHFVPSTVITQSHNSRPAWPLLPQVMMVPYICSELFFNNKPDDSHQDAIILALSNDDWSSLTYIKRLMFLTAQFKALEWQRDIVYVAYTFHGYIDKHGYSTPFTN